MANSSTVELIKIIQRSLTPDLLTPKWRKIVAGSAALYKGHCYAASEAAFHLLGGSKNGWVPQLLTHSRWAEGLSPGETHWFLKNKNSSEIVDPTAEQFHPKVVLHHNAKGCGFLTSFPSKRAQRIIDRVKEA